MGQLNNPQSLDYINGIGWSGTDYLQLSKAIGGIRIPYQQNAFPGNWPNTFQGGTRAIVGRNVFAAGVVNIPNMFYGFGGFSGIPTIVLLSYSGAPTNPGFLYHSAGGDNVSFNINSTNVADVSTVQWTLLKPYFYYPDIPHNDPTLVESVNPIDFDGATYLNRGAGLTGAADGKKGILSCWVKFGAIPDNVSARILFGTGTKFSFARAPGLNGGVRMSLRNAAGVNIGQISVGNKGYGLTDFAWHHFLISWDLSIPRMQLYIDDAEQTPTVEALVIDDIDYTIGDWAIGAQTNGTEKLTGCLTELYFNSVETIDLSVIANRRFFIDDNGRPQWMGLAGGIPTGSRPIMYMRFPQPTGWNINMGSGGNFAVTAGALGQCVTAP